MSKQQFNNLLNSENITKMINILDNKLNQIESSYTTLYYTFDVNDEGWYICPNTNIIIPVTIKNIKHIKSNQNVITLYTICPVYLENVKLLKFSIFKLLNKNVVAGLDLFKTKLEAEQRLTLDLLYCELKNYQNIFNNEIL